MDERMRVLGEIYRLCALRGEIDGGMLAPALGCTPAEGQRWIEILEAEGLVSTVEYGFSCSVEIMAEGLTAAGEALLAENLM